MVNERLLSSAKIKSICADTKDGNEVRNLLKAQDAKSIAARDKWWLAKVNPFIGLLISCIMSGEKLPDAYEQWQSLKQSLEDR